MKYLISCDIINLAKIKVNVYCHDFTVFCRVAFYSCKSLNKITLPKSLTSVGDKAFGACDVLRKGKYNSTKEQFAAITVGEGNEALTGATFEYGYSAVNIYPVVVAVAHDTKSHRFRLTWTPADCAEYYGIAVYSSGKWKAQVKNIPASATTFTSPKLKAGQTYKLAVVAKVNGKWDTSNISQRVVTVTVK